MKIKQISSIGIIAIVFSLFCAVGLGLIATPVAAADARPCEAIYTSSPVASDDAKAKVVQLLNACKQGYETNVCDGITASRLATKQEKEDACKAGQDYREVNPPAGTDPVAGNDCGGVKTAIIKCDADNSGGLKSNGIWALLLLVLNIMTAGVGILAVGGIVYGAILYTTAEDKADQVNKAIDIIRNVIIGLVAFALMYALLNFLIPGGLFFA